MLNWIEVNKPSIHGITRLRCGLYLCIEVVPRSWRAVKMGIWTSDAGLTEEQAKEECELHYLTERLKGNTYRPGSRPREEQSIADFYSADKQQITSIERLAKRLEDTAPTDPPEDES